MTQLSQLGGPDDLATVAAAFAPILSAQLARR
jgi:hypothetical protein